MSVWRKIWKESVIANRKMYFNQSVGEQAFEDLLKEYGQDGMIYYARAESYYLLGEKDKAKGDFLKAKELFPVEHWKRIADISAKFIFSEKKAENFYSTTDIGSQWYGFQKIWEFVYLDDFVRYITLSAISRVDVEVPLTLVDFRTSMELEIKVVYPQFVKRYDDNNYTLNDIINLIKTQKDFSKEIIDGMHKIRKDGNIATHEGSYTKKYGEYVENFIKVMNALNDRISFYKNYK